MDKDAEKADATAEAGSPADPCPAEARRPEAPREDETGAAEPVAEAEPAERFDNAALLTAEAGDPTRTLPAAETSREFPIEAEPVVAEEQAVDEWPTGEERAAQEPDTGEAFVEEGPVAEYPIVSSIEAEHALSAVAEPEHIEPGDELVPEALPELPPASRPETLLEPVSRQAESGHAELVHLADGEVAAEPVTRPPEAEPATTPEYVAATAQDEKDLDERPAGDQPVPGALVEPAYIEAEPAGEQPAGRQIAEESPAQETASAEGFEAEQVPFVPPAMDEPLAAAPFEPLRDRIPSVQPVELQAVKQALDVPVFEPRPLPRPLPAPTKPDPVRAPEVPLHASAAGSVTFPSADDIAPPRPRVQDLAPYLRRALRLAVIAAGALAGLVLVLIVLYRWVNPPASTLMLGQWLTGTRITRQWVPIDRISPYLHRAVITSEDGRFCQHHGVDWEEIEEAIERARDGIPRGGSTISMQVVKNLFLWPSKSYVRKAIEFPLTYAIELAWPKRRILEIYLNIAEWGPGIFGAEAAARYHFGKPAALLTPSQAALLAVSLPNPLERRAGAPGPGTLRLAAALQGRMRASAGNAACVRPPR